MQLRHQCHITYSGNEQTLMDLPSMKLACPFLGGQTIASLEVPFLSAQMHCGPARCVCRGQMGPTTSLKPSRAPPKRQLTSGSTLRFNVAHIQEWSGGLCMHWGEVPQKRASTWGEGEGEGATWPPRCAASGSGWRHGLAAAGPPASRMPSPPP